MSFPHSLAVGACLSVAVLSACADSQSSPPAASPQTTSGVPSAQNTLASGGNLNAVPTSGGGMSGATDVPATDPAALSDGQIAKIADTINAGEIDQGKYALQHATDPRVRQFAEHMVSAHGAIGQNMSLVLQKESITPAVSTVSGKLAKDGQSTMTDLAGKSGADFDKSYIAAQARGHKDALDLFDSDLVPRAKDPQLKAALAGVRPMVAEHLKEAEDLKKALH
jgi:putative membrane protein